MEPNEHVSFLKERFGEYYKKEKIQLPERFGKREFAFMPFGAKLMKRHISFKRREDFESFFMDMIPAHAYYSSAFYQNPGAPTMEEKGWMGAELIFDLDLDHLENSKVRSYEEGLDIVKQEFSRLVNDFLIEDFGFEKKYIKLYFSGSRGYHCHIIDPKVLSLDSSERREIVDYIIGNGIDEETMFSPIGEEISREIESDLKLRGISGENTSQGGIERIEKRCSKPSLMIPKEDEPGWRGKIGKGIRSVVRNLDKDEFKNHLISLGIGKGSVERLERELTPERKERILRYGLIDQSRFIRSFFLRASIKRIAVSSVSGETDEPVTCDTKRLIRLPSSLHGKTGLKVCQIDIDKLDDFDPLYDAVVFGDDPVRVRLEEGFSIKMKGESFSLDRGVTKVPEYLAVFLLGRGIAKIIN